MLEMITQPLAEPEQDNIAQHRHDIEAYQAYKRKDRVARILLLSSITPQIRVCDRPEANIHLCLRNLDLLIT